MKTTIMMKCYDELPLTLQEKLGFPTNYHMLNPDQLEFVEAIAELVEAYQADKILELEEDIDIMKHEIVYLEDEISSMKKDNWAKELKETKGW